MEEKINLENAKKAWELKRKGYKLHQIAEETGVPAPYLSFLFRVTDHSFYNDSSKNLKIFLLKERFIDECNKITELKKTIFLIHKELSKLEKECLNIIEKIKEIE